MEDPLLSTSKNVDDKKIETAVKFLQNPKVWHTPYSKKIYFLKNKGLNEEEVELAIERSGTKEEQVTQDVQQRHGDSSLRESQLISPGQSVIVQPRRWRDYLGVLVLGGGVACAAAYLIKTFILPYFEMRNEDEQTKRLEEVVTQLNSGFSEIAIEIRDSLQVLQKLLEEQQRLLLSINADLATTKARVNLVPSDVTSLSDIKTEITSLKGLMLGRRQFSPTPFGQSASPSIPAWQKAAVINKNKEKDGEGDLQETLNGDSQKSDTKNSVDYKNAEGVAVALEKDNYEEDTTRDVKQNSYSEGDQSSLDINRTPSQTDRDVISSLENSFSSKINDSENQVD